MIVSIGFRNTKSLYILGLGLMAVAAIATAAQPFLVGQIADSFLNDGPYLREMLLLVFVLDAVGSTFSRLTLGWASERFIFNIRNEFTGRILSAPLNDVERFDRGDINNRVIEDIPAFQRPYFSVYPELYGSLFITLLCFTGMFWTSWQLAVVLGAVLAFLHLGLYSF